MSPLYPASPDALEVIVVTHLRSVSTDLTDVTLVSDDTVPGVFSVWVGWDWSLDGTQVG